jgi:hypothetical protein
MHQTKAANARGIAAFLLVEWTRALFVIAIMQTFTGAAYLGKDLVRDQSGQACQHGNTHEMKQHRSTLSGVSPLQNVTLSR